MMKFYFYEGLDGSFQMAMFAEFDRAFQDGGVYFDDDDAMYAGSYFGDHDSMYCGCFWE